MSGTGTPLPPLDPRRYSSAGARRDYFRCVLVCASANGARLRFASRVTRVGWSGSTWPMSKNEPVDARIRLAIARWPLDAPRGSVTTFCAEHQISRKTFYVILARARTEGSGSCALVIGRRYAGQLAYVIYQIKSVEFFDHQGTFIAQGDWPPPGITYIGTSSLATKEATPMS